MNGLLAYGAYVPRYRLQRHQIAAVLGSGGGKGTRSVASYDEDVCSMAVAATSTALRGHGIKPQRLYLATTSPPYLDKTNAAVVHAALGLDRTVLAVDLGGAPRSAFGSLLTAWDASVPTVAVLSDLRTGLPGGADERDGGDAAAAFLFGPESASPVLAEVLSTASTTDEFLERWRTPGATASRTWEDRFSEHVYAPLVEDAFAAALKAADITPADVDHLVIAGLAPRPAAAFARSSGVPTAAVTPRLQDSIGNPGGAQLGLLLADVLDRALAGETIVLVQLADGASALVLRTTEHVLARRSPAPVRDQLPGTDVTYGTFLTWRGMLDREPPRRPEPDAPAAPPAYRSRGYKLGFRASECASCGTVTMPPAQVCFSCHALDQMVDRPMQDARGTVATFTVDRLAFTPSPPMIAVVVDFDGGGRFRCELTDAAVESVRIGMRVEPTFRRLLTADSVHNYFWKVRPA
jgi:hydroxymethylglutaryl-CoA synthase